ncbi:hypothetical protein [Thermoactinomyces sp. DSM 45892]|uniref:hypothetical protein n=1 Tax=Thermoactinomyces sp. DSM 45892 TaxID=1882753 RepID=UPI00089636CD|nr:hypothetical protein [Thermoactinomyces sp. DSM 45892]SDZ01135.1 hypothetical protein SAMN05444416_111117 [Thermoactinomyces sp. DSM 45892]
MTAELSSFPWSNQASSEVEWREMMRFSRSSGVIVRGEVMDEKEYDLAVTSGIGMQVQIAPGYSYIKGHFFKHTGDYYLLSIKPNQTGTERVDTVVLRADFTANSMNYAVLEASTTLTQTSTIWEIALAKITIPKDAEDSSVFSIQDMRDCSVSYALVPSTKQKSESNKVFTLPNDVYTTLPLREFAWNSTSGQKILDQIIVPQDGIYMVHGRIKFPWSQPPGLRGLKILKNGEDIGIVNQVYTAGYPIDISCSGMAKMFKGDYLNLQGAQITGDDMDIEIFEAGITWIAPIKVEP